MAPSTEPATTDDADGTNEDESALEAKMRAVLHHLPSWVQLLSAWLLSRWPGRIVINGLESFVRLDMFDRSMTVAAQFFTSVFPILILFATWAAKSDADRLGHAVSLPDETQSVLQDAVQGDGSASFGILGTLLVLASATSLSRALARAFAAIWDIPTPKSKLASVWRWLAVVLGLTLALVLARTVSDSVRILPPRDVWPFLVSFGLDVAVALMVPWLLLAGAVRARILIPGAVCFALLMLTVRPATAAWLPHALEVSADRYGPIGVAFTYLACLYTASLCFLASAVLGQVIATDRGGLGQWIHGPEEAKESNDHSAEVASKDS
ncbi:YhjD/YihY/BrkB family envelope integrity protein [Nocardioides sp. LHG3406-4]|uniref:YhjD/YihY/BrkB family envelope integrity protein n=1 Tax=Nocardioides sp. LHG3406-4 TaxID=2804575 RepID=UPI003CF4CE79